MVTTHIQGVDTGFHLARGVQKASMWGRLRLKCDGTCAEIRFGLSAKRTNPFKSAGGESVQSTTGSRAVYISLQGLYCSCKPVFCSHVTLTVTHSLLCFPFTSPPLRHRVPSHFTRTLPEAARLSCKGVPRCSKVAGLMREEFQELLPSLRQ